MHKTDALFPNIVSNVRYESLICFIMVHNLESNFLKVLNQSGDEIETGEKEKMDANVSEAQTNIENEARSLMES